MAPKPKVEVAREHLSKAQEEVSVGDLRDALQWSFASLEAAIDALAAKRGIAIEEQHWRRRDAARELKALGILLSDLSSLHQVLNEERKAMFYEGEEPELQSGSRRLKRNDAEGGVATVGSETGALARLAPVDAEVWAERLRFDRERASRHQSSAHAAITEAVRERAEAAGAEAVVLSGSTARGQRTQVSDLDYHVIGTASVQVADLPEDIDLYADEVDRFWSKLREGDDFSHWSVWYGCVLYDRGVIREATTFVAENDGWPDPERKLRQARGALDFAAQIVESGDYGAALEQARGALSLVSRWLLLSHDIFPLARDELSGQLERLGQARLARDLRRSVRERPGADDLRAAIAHAQAISQADRSAIRRVAA